MKICIVVSDYYKNIADSLLQGSITELKNKGFTNIRIKYVSGAFEIPNIISKNDINFCLNVKYKRGSVGNYSSFWMSPGGWSVKIYSNDKTYVFDPLEKGYSIDRNNKIQRIN